MSALQPPPKVEHLVNGQICVNCSFSEPSVNACVVIIHSTHNTSNLLGKQLKVYSINTNVVYDCFGVDEDEYHVVVFGLLNTGLERVPAVKMFIRRKDFATTPSGQFILKYNDVGNCIITMAMVHMCTVFKVIINIQ